MWLDGDPKKLDEEIIISTAAVSRVVGDLGF